MAILLPKNNYCGKLFVYNKARIVLTTKLYLKQLNSYDQVLLMRILEIY